MAREIKFRAWCNLRKKMIQWYDIELEWSCGNIKPWIQIGFTAPSFEYELMQYTGLHDKNGKEIYEGDVVKTYARGNQFDHEIKECLWIVEFNYSKWHAKHLRVSGNRYFNDMEFLDGKSDCEVIGNIHENPELLEDV